MMTTITLIIGLVLSLIVLMVSIYFSYKGMRSPDPDAEQKKDLDKFYETEFKQCTSNATKTLVASVVITLSLIAVLLVSLLGFTDRGKSAVARAWNN